DLGERERRGPVHRGRDLVSWTVLTTEGAAKSVVVLVLWGVPAIQGEVDATAERQDVVDDHNLLVMDGAGGPGPVDSQAQSPAAEPIHNRHGRDAVPHAVEDRQQAEVGLQHVNIEGRSSP